MAGLLAVSAHSESQAPSEASSGAMHMHAPAKAKAASAGKIRTYYIAADDVQWNYMRTAPTYVLRGENELVPVPPAKSNSYRKAMYREYTDDTFKTLKPRPQEWEHLGILGPLIRAEVGDTIKIVFKNNSSIICSMHAHGLSYDKDSEGAYYSEAAAVPPDATKKGDAVKPGERFTYTWSVPERAGPGPGDPSSMLWMYHSHFNESRDMNSGLIGPSSSPGRVPRSRTEHPKGWIANLWSRLPYSKRLTALT